MTEHITNPGTGANAPASTRTAGALLRAAREAAGLSVDAVAQQLRLAPRQVRALEEDDFTHLPGRTFIRGFVRNYARILRLDADVVLGALATGNAAPALAAPTLQPTAPTMGELPVGHRTRPGVARWVIPLTLVAIVAAAAIYEWLRPAGEVTPVAGKNEAPAERAAAPAPAPGPAPAPPPVTGTPLPNPLAPTLPADAAGTGSTAAPATEPARLVPPATPVTVTTPESAAAAGVTGTPAAPGAGEVRLVLQFRDFSWTEVKDRDGRVLLARMNPAGTTQSVAGTPPLQLVIGNAADVRATYKGQPLDLAPHTRQNVARFTLP